MNWSKTSVKGKKLIILEACNAEAFMGTTIAIVNITTYVLCHSSSLANKCYEPFITLIERDHYKIIEKAERNPKILKIDECKLKFASFFFRSWNSHKFIHTKSKGLRLHHKKEHRYEYICGWSLQFQCTLTENRKNFPPRFCQIWLNLLCCHPAACKQHCPESLKTLEILKVH